MGPKRNSHYQLLSRTRAFVRAGYLVALLVLSTTPSPALAQANGRLQIHFMNVGHGDDAVLTSPRGQIVLFDDGVWNNCDLPPAYLQQLGVP